MITLESTILADSTTPVEITEIAPIVSRGADISIESAASPQKKSSIDITEFVKTNRQTLFDALIKAGVPAETMREEASRQAPWGRWNRRVTIYSETRPVAQYWLSYPILQGLKTVKFNIATFERVASYL